MKKSTSKEIIIIKKSNIYKIKLMNMKEKKTKIIMNLIKIMK